MKRSTIHFEHGVDAASMMYGRSGMVARVAASVGVLAISAVLVGVAVQVRSTSSAIDETQQELTQMQSAASVKTVRLKNTMSSQQRRALNQITRQLNTPWSQLLDGLEASLPEDVALVSIEPRGASAKVRVQAEAKTLETVIAYASTLRQQPFFAAVNLVKHETNDQDPNHPVRLMLEFTLVPSRPNEPAVAGAQGNGR